MARGKKHSPEQIVSLLRQVEVGVANGKTTPMACREGGITEQTRVAHSSPAVWLEWGCWMASPSVRGEDRNLKAPLNENRVEWATRDAYNSMSLPAYVCYYFANSCVQLAHLGLMTPPPRSGKPVYFNQLFKVSAIQMRNLGVLNWSRKFGRGFKWRVCSSAA